MFDLQHVLDLVEEGAFDKVTSTLRQVVAQMPAYAPAYVLLAQAYEAQERWPEALATWQRAHFFAPNSPVVEAGLWRVLDRQDAVSAEPSEDNPPGAMDQMADELLETIRDEASPSPPADDALDEEAAPSVGAPSSPEPAPTPLEELMRRPPPDEPLPDDIRDLNRLIEELEEARIDPQPNLDDVPAPDLDSDIEDVVSETLARIYASQKKFEEAARVYLRLASQEPEQADAFLEKAADMRSRAQGEE